MGYLDDKIADITAGRIVIASDSDLDAMIARIDEIPALNNVASLPNPARMGTKDTWIAFLKGPIRGQDIQRTMENFPSWNLLRDPGLSCSGRFGFRQQS